MNFHDEPLMDVEDIKNLNQRMINSNSDIGTLASKITEKISRYKYC